MQIITTAAGLAALCREPAAGAGPPADVVS